MSDVYDPRDRRERFLKGIMDGDGSDLPDPENREEIYLKAIADNAGGGGGGSSDLLGFLVIRPASSVSVEAGTTRIFVVGNNYYPAIAEYYDLEGNLLDDPIVFNYSTLFAVGNGIGCIAGSAVDGFNKILTDTFSVTNTTASAVSVGYGDVYVVYALFGTSN